MCFFERRPSGGHLNWWWIEDLTWTPSTIPASLFRVISVKTVAMNDDTYLFFFQCEGWLHSTCTHKDKRLWTASKAVSVSLSKSHWQTWSVVHTVGAWKRDLFAHGRKGSLVWQDYHAELLACFAVTASSCALREACPKSLFLQAVFLSWRCRAFMSSLGYQPPRWPWPCSCSQTCPELLTVRWGSGQARELLPPLYLCLSSEGSAGKLIKQQKLLFHVGELGKRSTKPGRAQAKLCSFLHNKPTLGPDSGWFCGAEVCGCTQEAHPTVWRNLFKFYQASKLNRIYLLARFFFFFAGLAIQSISSLTKLMEISVFEMLGDSSF